MAKIDERRWTCDVPGEVLCGIQAGSLRTRYRDRLFVKNPFDVVIYMQLLGRQKPRTVIEIGSRQGGSALWFHDMLAASGVDARVVSVDLTRPPEAGPGISFLTGDAHALGSCLGDDLLATLPRPWLVSEDSAHTFEASSAVLRFFDPHLQPGDYIVVEDGVIQFFPDAIPAAEHYRALDNGPNRAVSAFLADRGQDYDVDVTLCDYFGYNVTFNPNAWLRRL